MSQVRVYTHVNPNDATTITLEVNGGSRRSRSAKLGAVVRRLRAAELKVERISIAHDESAGVLGLTAALYRVSPTPIATDALLAEIEEWQAANRGNGLFLPEHHDIETLTDLWYAGHIIPGSRTSAPGKRLGWYSVRMIEADHAEALGMNS